MKRLLIKLSLLLLVLPSFGQHTYDNAADYNNFIVNEQNQLIASIVDYNISTIHNSNIEENEQKRITILQQIDASIGKLRLLNPYKGDSKLKDEALSVLLLYQETCDVEFNEINLLRKKRESSFEAMRNYLTAQGKAEDNLRAAGDRFFEAQKQFAKKYNVTIQDQKHKGYFEDVGKVNQYSRQVFLEYFRVSSSDALFLEALNNQQASLIEEKRKEILSASEVSLKNLNAVIPYNHDSTYKVKAIELIHYHRQLAGHEYAELVQILQKKGRTQQDVNRYNEIVLQVNANSQILVSALNAENREMLKRNIPVY